MKFYSCHKLNANYDIALNHIFFKSAFKDYFTAKYKICPSGLTIGCHADENEIKSFSVLIKKYGYESLSNNGFEYSDLSDYTINTYYQDKLTQEMREYCVEYLATIDPELYETVKKYIKY